MRVRALLVSLVAAATCVITGTSAGHPPAALAHECGHPRGPLLAYGHSYLASPRIAGAPASYATLAAATPRVKPVARAKDGDTTADVEKLVRRGPTRWVSGSSDVVLIDSAINDIQKGLPTKIWPNALRRTLTTFTHRPVPVILLVRRLQVDAAGGWNPRTDLSTDGIHPNLVGERHLARGAQHRHPITLRRMS